MNVQGADDCRREIGGCGEKRAFEGRIEVSQIGCTGKKNKERLRPFPNDVIYIERRKD